MVEASCSHGLFLLSYSVFCVAIVSMQGECVLVYCEERLIDGVHIAAQGGGNTCLSEQD